MRTFAALALVAIGFAGCVANSNSRPSYDYGDFISQSAATELRETLVTDTVKQLVSLYPPASTRFDLTQPVADLYGAQLVQSLRQNGYALSESAPSTNAQGLILRYVVDSPEENLYRVTLQLGSQSLSRAYQTQNEKISPAGAWVRRE